MSRRPLIGVTVGARERDGETYARLRMTYVEALEQAGAIAVIVPPVDQDAVPELIDRLDGLLLPGGADVDPGHYGEEMRGSNPPDPALDHLELAAARYAFEQDLPTLGICRGQQVINVALGGSLIQHIDGHAPDGARDALYHALQVAPGSRLAHVLGSSDLQVNSHHHQAVNALGKPLRAVGWSDDGTIEGIEAPDRTWFLAVQFHPEDLVGTHAPSQRLFAAFVAACTRTRRRV